MDNQTVKQTAELKLCISCGMCKNICPVSCISWKRENGMYYPVIDERTCVHCGKCLSVCPGIGMSYETLLDSATGTYSATYNGWSKDEQIRHVSASGGVITTMIQALLECKMYDVAFCVGSYDYRNQLTVKNFYADENHTSSPKSRYLPVSHENTVTYISQNPDKKAILIGTSCAIRGLLNVINEQRLNRENYLLVGLFCDKVFNYNVHDYFQKTFCGEDELVNVHFKNKESGGWPGNMKFFLEDGRTFYIDKDERGKIKEYFMPERCLYCIDKLNVSADISLGDNYTTEHSSELGSNSIFIRTELGQQAWLVIADRVEFYPVSVEKIHKAQYIDGRLNNAYYAALKEEETKKKYGVDIQLNKGVVLSENIRNYEQAWKRNLARLHAGEVYDIKPEELDRQMHLDDKKNSKSIRSFVERGYYAIKRRIR